MDETCFSLIVRDRVCQSGVPLISEKVFTNLPEETISLKNGYTLTVSNGPSDNILLQFINNAFGINVTYTIKNNSYGIFDLPIDNGTYRVGIFSKKRNCNIPICCCNPD